jgi:ABC-2 type transport system ATP-binding protein
VKGDRPAFAARLAARGAAATPADDHLLVRLPKGEAMGVLWDAAEQAGEQIRALRPRRSTLEEIFLGALAEQS